MSPQVAARLGLEQVWTRQLRVPGGSRSIVDQQIVVHQDTPKELVEVVEKAEEGEEPRVLFRISTEAIGDNGQQIGTEEAQRLARREVRRLQRRAKEPTIRTRSVPRIRLYTAATNGTIECRDAENGMPVWMTQVGEYQLHYSDMGVDDKYVTITNGANLIEVDVTNGEPINTVRMMSVPLYGSTNVGDFALVPTIRNGVEGYPLRDTTRDPFMKIVAGLALHPPTKSPSSSIVAWGTDRGFVYFMEMSGEPEMRFRLNTDGIVSGRIAAIAGDRFFFGSESGQVYGVRATRTGEVMWSQPYAEPFYKAPFVLDGKVLLVSAYGNLFALDENTGLSRWDDATPNVDQIMGGFDGRVFVRLLSGDFAVIDAETGDLVENVPSLRPEKLLINRHTDRLYLINSTGTVQCLRTIGAEMPTVRQSTEAPAEEEEKAAADAKPKQAQPKSTDPFGGQAKDPFGAAGEDPFGAGGNDPFGGGGDGDDEAMDDPFGGGNDAGNDPFGGDPFGN
jgi:hypothetical protein